MIDLIYAALLGEASWQDFLDGLAAGAPDGKTVLIMHDDTRDNGHIPLASGIPSDVLNAYNTYYSTVNPFMRPTAIRPVGKGFVDDELVPPSDLARTEFFADFLKPHEMSSRVAMTIGRDSGYLFVLATLGSSFDDDCKQRLADQLTRLGPHLKRASDYYRNGSAVRAATELGASLFDAVEIGLIVIGDGARIKVISETAQTMLRGASPFGMSPLGRIKLRDDDANAVLRAMLERTYEGPKIAGVSLNGFRLTLIRVQKDQISSFFEGPTIVVLMEQPGMSMRRTFDAEQVALVYGLSRTETRALSGILEGKSVSQIAEDAAVSRETIRTQLKGVYAKTGVKSQADLIRLVHAIRH
ncbi:helix-turn-helix transcriptional regulator [Agrobacterium tumefaciens]|uniref:helix-turn-helix transcriptional regulator n=1 Tax=Agrobacterium tumefaciens TaxID=358 RepID=UPI002244BF40|nr:helix-turn-helix transcriptional regulator [Agrobacterium tumefaciens]MCW8060447.1 helix-turn-helix transcriptional regulator [Agrobacterium tumefaciens]MCW8145891.1 helix-turn-helix transcriptional regulator [Agrobacterium tumefaciens]